MNIGIDIVDIKRFENYSQEKLIKIFTPKELDYCNSFCDKQIHLAGMFCAKEALVKALKTGFRKINPNQIEILHDENGAPFYNIENLNGALNNKKIDLSISHTKQIATAICLIYE